MSENQKAWTALCSALRGHFGEKTFDRWFDKASATVAPTEEGPVLVIAFPTRLARDWVDAHYGDTVRTWRQISQSARVDFVLIEAATAGSETQLKQNMVRGIASIHREKELLKAADAQAGTLFLQKLGDFAKRLAQHPASQAFLKVVQDNMKKVHELVEAAKPIANDYVAQPVRRVMTTINRDMKGPAPS